jgi:hypothetical protein
MADTPAFLTLCRNRDEAGRREVPIRRSLVTIVSSAAIAFVLILLLTRGGRSSSFIMKE